MNKMEISTYISVIINTLYLNGLNVSIKWQNGRMNIKTKSIHMLPAGWPKDTQTESKGMEKVFHTKSVVAILLSDKLDFQT